MDQRNDKGLRIKSKPHREVIPLHYDGKLLHNMMLLNNPMLRIKPNKQKYTHSIPFQCCVEEFQHPIAMCWYGCCTAILADMKLHQELPGALACCLIAAT